MVWPGVLQLRGWGQKEEAGRWLGQAAGLQSAAAALQVQGMLQALTSWSVLRVKVRVG